MRIYDVPEEVPFECDYSVGTWKEMEKQHHQHAQRLEAWLRANGYNGARTGQVYRAGVADGYAQYMVAEGRRTILIHLPYGDAYHDQNVQYIPKKELFRRIDAEQRRRAELAARRRT